MSILVLTEGPTDRGAIRSVAKRLGIKVRVSLMLGNRVEKLKGTIIGLAAYHDKFIVLKDLHTYQEDAINRRYGAVLKELDTYLKKKARLVIVRHAIEAWFLADINALNRTFNCRIEREIPNPEGIKDPAKKLNEILEGYGKRYYKSEEIGKKIMMEADLDKIAEKSSSFKRFLNYLTDP